MGARIFLVVAIVFTAVATVVVAGAPVHHVVGEDRGWDPSTDITSWYSQRVFRVGDKICELLSFSFLCIFFFLIQYFRMR